MSRSRFVDATGHIVSGTVGGRTRFVHSQSANLSDIQHPEPSCNHVFANRIPSSALEHFSTLAGLPTDSHATHHDDAALRLDATQAPRLSQQSNQETKLFEIVVACRHHRVDRPGYDFHGDSHTGEVLITRLSNSTTKSLRTKWFRIHSL